MGLWLAWTSRCALSMVFAVAAWGKFADPSWTRFAVSALVPLSGRGVARLARALPAAEAVVAVAVLPRPTAAPAAVAAIVLLVAFCVVIVRALRRGEHPACACFGEVSSAPLGPRSVLRNLALVAVAAVALVGARRYHGAALPASQALTVAAVAAVSGIVALQQAELRELRQRLPAPHRPGLDVGAVAPAFSLPDTLGGERSLADLLAGGRPVALVFLHATCGSCREVAADLAGWQEQRAGEIDIVVVANGEADDNKLWHTDYGIPWVLLERDFEVADRYRCYGSPNAVVVGPDGRIARDPAVGVDQIRARLAPGEGERRR